MSKKSNNALLSYSEKAFHYRWEFLRRKDAYRAACDAWLKLRKRNHNSVQAGWQAIYDKYTCPPMDYRHDIKTIFAEYKKYFDDNLNKFKAWQGRIPFIEKQPYIYDYTWIFLLTRDYDEAVHVVGLSEDIMFNNMGRKLTYPKKLTQLKNINTLKVEVNLTYPKEQIMWQLDKMVKMLKKSAVSIRVRFADYKRYVKTYDDFSRSKDLTKLSKKKFSADIERGETSYAKRKTKREYDIAKKFVDEDYVKIR
jgi:hypothetical protein